MKNGRIAIPSNKEGGLAGQRSGHFGHCDVFTIVDVEDGQISNVEIVMNQEHSQGGCLVPVQLLNKHKVNAIVVAGIGMRPLVGFNQVGIDVYYDSTQALIKPVVEDLIGGKLQMMQTDQSCGGGSGTCH